MHAQPIDPGTPEGACVVPALAHLPPPRSDAVCEQPVDFYVEGVHYTGYIDLLHSLAPKVSIVVHDHKTTGSLRWAKTPAELLEDPQRILYSYWGAKVCDVPTVIARWGYYQRKPPAVRLVEVTESASDIEQRFATMHRAEGLAIAQAHGQPPETLPRNLSHCSAYGGCPYRADCHATLTAAEIAAAALT